jgi:MinD superfamily P-loop ATPase
MLELPQLDETRCSGCGDCVPACPVDCLELAGRLPWLPRPTACVSCGICVLICPENALVLENPTRPKMD